MVRSFIKHLYYDTAIGHILISPAKRFYDAFRYNKFTDKRHIEKTFKNKLGYDLSLENPKTLNEKIQWLKLNDRNPLHTLCADKFAVREYVKEKIGGQYLIPLVFYTENPADITSENIPDFPCAIKTNHDSSGVIIVKDKSRIDWQNVQNTLAESLRKNYYHSSREWQYKNIKPCILVEKLLQDNNFKIPSDLKFHCFNGSLAFIQEDIDRYGNHRRNIYHPDWDFIDCQWSYKNKNGIEKPDMLHEMTLLAETLAKEFIYVRVDFYNLGSEIYFGELTFHPASGFKSFTPSEWDRKFGDKLILNCNNKNK
jgi:hypothetical protein